jgi:hypothetical protein
MPGPTVRISPRAHRMLKEMSARTGMPMQLILDSAIEQERRRQFLTEANQSYEKVKSDVDAWDSLEQERAEWDATLLDGLTHEGTAPP